MSSNVCKGTEKMKIKLDGFNNLVLNTLNKTLEETVSGKVIDTDDIIKYNTNMYGYDTYKPYEWYKEYFDLGIKVPEKFRKHIKDIEITFNNFYKTQMTRSCVQTKEPVVIKFEDVEYALLFRFGYLAVSEDGRILDINTNKIIRDPGDYYTLGTDAYKYYWLNHCDYLMHRLITEAWIYNDDPTVKTQVNHKNGIKTYNKCTNLEWISASGNIQHLFDNGMSNQNIEATIRHKDTKEIKHFPTTGGMCRFLGCNQMNFKTFPLGYLNKGYEVRTKDDPRDWYYKTGDEQHIPITANSRYEVIKDNKIVKIFYNIRQLNLAFGWSIKKYTSTTIQDVVTKDGETFRVIDLKLSGPYDVKNLETLNIKRFETIKDISLAINYNETSVANVVDTNKSIKNYAIKRQQSNWMAEYTDVAGSTKPKKFKIINTIDKSEQIANSFMHTVTIVGTTKKTLRKSLLKTNVFKNFIITQVE